MTPGFLHSQQALHAAQACAPPPSCTPRRRATAATALRAPTSPPSAAASATAGMPSGGAAAAACQAAREGGTATPSVLSTLQKYSKSAAQRDGEGRAGPRHSLFMMAGMLGAGAHDGTCCQQGAMHLPAKWTAVRVAPVSSRPVLGQQLACQLRRALRAEPGQGGQLLLVAGGGIQGNLRGGSGGEDSGSACCQGPPGNAVAACLAAASSSRFCKRRKPPVSAQPLHPIPQHRQAHQHGNMKRNHAGTRRSPPLTLSIQSATSWPASSLFSSPTSAPSSCCGSIIRYSPTASGRACGEAAFAK